MVVPIRLASTTWRSDERGRAAAASAAVIPSVLPRVLCVHGSTFGRRRELERREHGMISITLEHTDNLGPEADIPALLVKLAQRLETARLEPGTLVRVGARALTDYVVGQSDWASLSAMIRVPAAEVGRFKTELFDDL